MQPQKNITMTLALLTSVCMMMFVASLFHLPKGETTSGLLSNFINNISNEENSPNEENFALTTYNTFEITPVSYLPQQ